MKKAQLESRKPILRKLSTFLILNIISWGYLSAQPFEILKQLEGHKTKVYFSSGNLERAELLAERLDKVYNFYTDKISFEPKVTLLILNPQDWSKFTTFPVYGMPHYDEKREFLIVASEDNAFWRSFVPDLNQIPKNQADEISSTYTVNNVLTMQPFFDLLAIHEIGHAYHYQAGVTMQRKWMAELFCNIMLHTYIAENEPAQLKALTVFPQMVISNGTKGFKYTALEDIENHYEDIGKNHARNYGWFQSRWHAEAGKFYDSAGIKGFSRLWNAFKNQKTVLDNPEFEVLLSDVHQSLADVQLKWNE